MVDFNAKETIGTPAVDIVRVLWLQARDNLLQAWQAYQEKKLLGSDPNLNTVHARLITLYNEMQAYLSRTLPDKPEKNNYSFTSLSEIIYSNSIDDNTIIKLIQFFNVQLDAVNLIKIDTRAKVDTTRVEIVNKMMGL